jgi:hypothetical protein
MIYMIESQIEHVSRAVRELDRQAATTIEVNQAAHDRYNEVVDRKMATTVWQLGGCTSYYQDATGRNAALWPDWTFSFRRKAKRWKPDAYVITGEHVAGSAVDWIGQR